MNLAQAAHSLATSPEARSGLGAVNSDLQGRPATTGDQPWIEAQQAALASGSTTLIGVRQDLAASLTSDRIARMVSGRNLQRYDVHHILPLDDGGTNAFASLGLIENDPDHYLPINYQNSVIDGMKADQTRMLEWPILDQPTLFWLTRPDGSAISIPASAAAGGFPKPCPI